MHLVVYCRVVLQGAALLLPKTRQPTSPAGAPAPVRDGQMAAGQVPRNPQYADIMERVRSFDGKVSPRGQDIQELASAGFYHVGKETSVASGVFLDDYSHSVLLISVPS